MKKTRLILILLILLVLIGVGVYFGLNYFYPKAAGLTIETNPTASVFINDEQVGRTPFSKTLPPGEIVVKLVPDSFDAPLVPFETKVTLVSGVQTVITRQFAGTLDASSGEVLTFEQEAGDDVGISVISVPEVVQIAVDGQVLGFAPFKTTAIEAGEHKLKLTAPGYVDKEIGITTHAGYKLTVVAKLAVDPASQQEETPQTPEKGQKVEILSTPTGFLRVRSEASTLGTEVGQVKPGEEYTFVEEDKETGWYKIEFEDAKGDTVQGWISGDYAKLVDN